ncbi:hypothetical protein BBJ28_00005846 [Nothophytophthora sp. Chile5]|nr:hypothetical protein BBJ28_00005846 [Nothophytophthora sp. Chile5]
MSSAKEKVEAAVASSRVVVFSKSYCPYCSDTKALLQQLGVAFSLTELDEVADGAALQDALADLTGSAGMRLYMHLSRSGQRSVPNTFIGGKTVGGNSELQALHRSGQLVPLLKTAGALS